MFLPRDPGPTGKSEHDRHRMGHHVMHLGGDPGTFCEGRVLDALPDELGEGFTAFPLGVLGIDYYANTDGAPQTLKVAGH